jgi:hypothetical protein
MNAERWKLVAGFPGYEVSDLGQVRSVDRTVIYRDGRRRTYPSVLLTPIPTGLLGHLRVNLGRDAEGVIQRRYVHRIVLEAFVGPCPDGMEGCHGPTGPTDNRLSNLRWDTRSANNHDKAVHGTDHNAMKTMCPRRHGLVAPNLVSWSAQHVGHRQCLACARARAYVQNHPGADLQAVSDRYYAALKVVA